MKSLKKDLQAVTKQLKALVRKTEKLAESVNKLETAATPKKAKSKRVKKAAAKKRPAKKAAARGAKKRRVTATDQVLGTIGKETQGVDVPGLVKKTGFDEKKVRNIVARAFKMGKIKRTGRGIYVGA